MNALLLLVLTLAQEPAAREVLFEEGRAIEVRPAVSTAERHATCVVTFPEDTIETLVAAWSEAEISLERRKNVLFVKLLRPASGDLHVLGASGTFYRLAISPGDDGAVRIHRPIKKDREGVRPVAPSLEFIRSMRLGHVPPETEVRRGGPAVVFRTGPVEARCRYVYENERFTGFVLEMKNTGTDPYRIDPSKFRAKDLIVVGAREHVVPPQGATLVYLVFARQP